MGEVSGGAKLGCCCCAAIAFVSIIMFACSWATLQPTQYGLLKNTFTGTVDTSRVYTAGRYFVYIGHSFIVFPGNLVTIQMSNNDTADAPPISARTGGGGGNSQGGQPVNISLSFQYRFPQEAIPFVYQQYGVAYKQQFIQYVRQRITNVVQEKHVPHDFWLERAVLVDEMRDSVNQTLFEHAKAECVHLQMLRAQFADKFEQQIINIQIANQAQYTSEYEQQVISELKHLDVLRAVNQANITEINAAAAASSTLINNQATTTGFSTVQAQKAESYRTLRDTMGLDNDGLVAFLKLQAINNHASQGNMVVGVPSPTAKPSSSNTDGSGETQQP